MKIWKLILCVKFAVIILNYAVVQVDYRDDVVVAACCGDVYIFAVCCVDVSVFAACYEDVFVVTCYDDVFVITCCDDVDVIVVDCRLQAAQHRRPDCARAGVHVPDRDDGAGRQV